MTISHIGETAAFATAICWTITGVCFEIAGKKVGSFAVNLIRLLIAFFIMSIYNYFTRGLFLPIDANSNAWLWLIISGLIGFVLGDLFLFQAYVLIGTRVSMLIMSLAPPITAIFGYFILGESLGIAAVLGIALVVSGIIMVIFTKNDSATGPKVGLSKSLKGLLYALLGALGQAFGMITSKIGMRNYSNAFAATQIRIIAGIAGFLVLYAVSNRWKEAYNAVKNKKAMLYTTIGAIMGPFLGVSLSLYAVNNTKAAIASTITSIMPILVIPISIFIFKEKVKTNEILGAVVTIAGIIILFI